MLFEFEFIESFSRIDFQESFAETLNWIVECFMAITGSMFSQLTAAMLINAPYKIFMQVQLGNTWKALKNIRWTKFCVQADYYVKRDIFKYVDLKPSNFKHEQNIKRLPNFPFSIIPRIGLQSLSAKLINFKVIAIVPGFSL